MMNVIASEDDFTEVFVEEAREVLQTIDDQLAVWRRQPADRNALTEIRRGFHTLKGSGRMVNALDLADVAWKIEHMLNRVIDGRVQVTEPLLELVSTVRDLMPKMLDTFKHGRTMGTDSEAESLMAQADALAADQASTSACTQPAVFAATVSERQSQALKVAALERRLERLQKRSDEALHRSEMALQLARNAATQIGTMKGQVRDRVDRSELNRVIARIDRVVGEVRDLSRDTKQPKKVQASQLREFNQFVDRRVRERMAPMETLRSDLEQQVDEANRAADASRSLARLALVLSTVVGAGAIAVLLM